MKRILLTGGGTAGHVTPNMALIPELKKRGFEVHYIGSREGIESELIRGMGISYYGISCGKLRRYFDLKNFTDPAKVVKGYFEAADLIKRLKPAALFSKGGFVSVPVVLAAGRRRLPILIHESDMTPGLANKLCIPFASKICCNFPETIKYLPSEKAVLTGTPIRKELLAGNRLSALRLCRFTSSKPIILVIGGSLGSASVNDAVRRNLDALLRDFQIAHICGKGKLDNSLTERQGYIQFEYVKEELADLFSMADLVISRAGANAICELAAMNKPNLLIPLPASSSRGDQILNARSFEQQGFSMVLEEEQMTDEVFLQAVSRLYQDRSRFADAMKHSSQSDATDMILGLIEEAAQLP